MTLGNNIKKYRHDLGITQEELAGILCVTRQAVSKWESGASLPEVTRIVPLAQALKCSFSAHTTKGKTFKEKEIQNVIYMLSQMFNLSEG
ncbi:MAG: helix-turn-helix transcriptional regulator [Lachnospiraceae bacterium]|nr:helix-turn-helix transcriptional regulator [Lachnospiraceae bacterium]